jgi:RHS repeat-associated protein
LSRSYSYDAAGNTTGDGSRTFAYNDAGRLKTATAGSVTTTYSYNGLGERVKKTSSGATTYFAYDEAGHLIGEYDAAGDLVQETVWFGDIPVAVLTPNGAGVHVFYIHTDHLNTPRRITRPSDDEIVWRWDSDPFGATAANDDPDEDTVDFAYHLRFPGQYFDAETGLHYNYFRDYDAVTGRYIQSDPLGLRGGINTFAYAGGNPVAHTDPLGLDYTTIDTWCRQNLAHCVQVMAGGALGLSGTTRALLKTMPDTADPCAWLQDRVRTELAELQRRREAMLVDSRDLYTVARNAPNPTLPKEVGSWKGHQIQYYQQQQRLANAIAAAAEVGCLVPIDAWLWANMAPPIAPRRLGGK